MEKIRRRYDMEKKSVFDTHAMYMTLANAVLASIASYTSIISHETTPEFSCTVIAGSIVLVIEIAILIRTIYKMKVEGKKEKSASENKARTDTACKMMCVSKQEYIYYN